MRHVVRVTFWEGESLRSKELVSEEWRDSCGQRCNSGQDQQVRESSAMAGQNSASLAGFLSGMGGVQLYATF